MVDFHEGHLPRMFQMARYASSDIRAAQEQKALLSFEVNGDDRCASVTGRSSQAVPARELKGVIRTSLSLALNGGFAAGYSDVK
jgi:hypothetical protein